MTDDAAPFLAGAGQESWNVFEGHQGHVERVAEPNEACGFVRCIDVEATREDLRLVGDHADGSTAKVAKAAHDVLGPVCLNFHEAAVVEDLTDHVDHVVGLVWFVGKDGLKGFTDPIDGVVCALFRWPLHVVEWEHVHEVPSKVDGAGVIFGGEMRDAGLRAVGHCATEVFEGHDFVGDRFDDLWAGDEHVRRLIDHDDEIRDGRAVHGTASTGAHDHRDLWDDAAGTDVAEENLRIGPQRGHAFLNAGAAGIVHADDRSAGLESHVQNLADFQAVHLTEASTVDREILRKGVHLTAVDGAVAGDHAVAGNDVPVHAKVSAAVFHQSVHLLETAFVEQHFQALTRGHLSTGMLGLDAGLTAAHLDLRLPGAEVFQSLLSGCHGLT